MQYRFEEFVFDTAQFVLQRDGQRVDVQPQVLKLLTYLLENRDRVVSRAELIDKMFGQRVVTDNALTVRVRDLRRALSDNKKPQQIVATIPGIGYRFIAPVEARTHVWSGESERPDEADLATEPNLGPGAKPSIAILPFEVIGDGSENAIIARGLVHDIITRIARTRTMLVVARGSAFQFSSGGNDVGTVGAKLGVRYVVQGAVQISGDKLRVSVGMANTETREEFWSEQYDRQLDDVLVLQEDIASIVVAALDLEVQRAETQRSILLPSSRLDAWSAYHRGLNHMYHFRHAECDQAEKYFRRAVDLEPDVPRPYAGLAFVNYERAFLGLKKEREDALRRALDHANHAISVDPNDPMGHWALSRAQCLEGSLDAARNSVEEAIRLNPSYVSAQYFRGWVAMQLGEREICRDRVDMSLDLSPLDPLIYGMLGVSALNLALMGLVDEAMQRIREAMVHPDIHYQAQAVATVIYGLCGELEKARDMFVQVKKVNPNYSHKEFLATFAFQLDDDIRRIVAAFESVERMVGKTH